MAVAVAVACNQHTISGVVTPPTDNMHFVGAHYHCHAPTCISMEIYNNVTGELLCREEPYHGQVRTVPVAYCRSFAKRFPLLFSGSLSDSRAWLSCSYARTM